MSDVHELSSGSSETFEHVALFTWHPGARSTTIDTALTAIPGHKALVILGSVSGSIDTMLVPRIREIADSGIPVFLVSSGYAQEGGISSTMYGGMRELFDAGVTPVEQGNLRDLRAILSVIERESQISEGNTLRDRVRDLFSAPHDATV